MIFNKKTVLSICFLMLVGAFASAQQQITNFGIVDTNKVYEYFFRTSTGARNYDSKRKEMQDEIDRLTLLESELESIIKEKMMVIPNIIDDSVPIGKDDSENVEVERFNRGSKNSNIIDFLGKFNQ